MLGAAGKVSLRYFTGTGNSRRIAEACAAVFAESGRACDVSSIPAGGPPATDAGAACFVFPVYSLDLPRIARRYLESLVDPRPSPSAPALPALLLVTGGDVDDCGWSLVEGSRILGGRGFDARYMDIIGMPNNWSPFSEVPGPEEAASILAKGEAAAVAATSAFMSGERHSRALSLGKFGTIGSALIRHAFRLGVKRLWAHFKTDGTCDSCGLCAGSCPTGSLGMREGRPSWSAGCEQCMRCYNLCPKRSIHQLESIGHGSSRGRYMEPHFIVSSAVARGSHAGLS